MERRDWWLLGVLLPLALLALALHMREIVRSGLAEPFFYVSAPESAEAYPRVSGFRLDLMAPPSALRLGDRVLRVGGEDVRGRGHIGVDAVALARADAGGTVVVAVESGGEVREIREVLGHPRLPWSRLPGLISITLVSVIVLMRSRAGAPARFFFLAFMVTVIFQAQFHGPSPWQTWLSKSMFYVLGAVTPALLVLWALYFPPEAPRHGRAVLLIPCMLVAAFAIPRLSYVLGGPMSPEHVPTAINLAHLAFALASLGAMTWNYRRSPPVGRRRIKWVLWGVWIGLLPLVANATFVATEAGRAIYPYTADYTKVALAAVSIGLLLSMQRQSLFDVDRVLGVTATYSLLLCIAAAGILLIVPTAAEIASRLFGVAHASAQLALSTGLAVGLLPLQTALRPRIDRLFFPERFAAQGGVSALLHALAHETDTERALSRCGEEMTRAFGATSGLIYQRRGMAYERSWPSELERASAPNRIAEGDPVIAAVQASPDPILADGRRSGDPRGLPPEQRQLLETFAAALVASLHAPEGAIGFLCLGPRRSRDLYTATDAQLVSALAAQLALSLVQDKERRMREYVPEAVRSQLDERGQLAAEEREVSVVFVDIRGYTARSAGSEVHAVFDVLNAYTRSVSTIVRDFGGQVVEFHGDGLMAVFGAPGELPAKERSAVLAAREITRALSQLESGALTRAGAERGLEVGIGVATGPAFVGNIRAVDRSIWSAIGPTTNLAARLQALTRDLDAVIAIDDTTRRRAGDAAQDFVEHAGTFVRGLAEAIVVHTRGAARGEPDGASEIERA